MSRSVCSDCSKPSFGLVQACDNCKSFNDGLFETDDEDFTGSTWHDSPPEALESVLSFPYSEESLLRCKFCGTVFYYHTFTPGGSYDVMKTVHVEELRRLKQAEVIDEVSGIAAHSRKVAVESKYFVEDDKKLQLQARKLLELLNAPGDSI